MEADVMGNVLRIRYRGIVTAAHMMSGVEQVERLLLQMQAGFTVLADLSGLEVMDLACTPYVSKMMDRFKAKGVGMVVRVIPDPTKDIGFNILSLIHYRGKVSVITCNTLAEAERAMK
jgi:hypothetical protein